MMRVNLPEAQGSTRHMAQAKMQTLTECSFGTTHLKIVLAAHTGNVQIGEASWRAP